MSERERDSVTHTRRWVVKIGSALITADGKGLDRERLREWVDQIADLIAAGRRRQLQIYRSPAP